MACGRDDPDWSPDQETGRRKHNPSDKPLKNQELTCCMHMHHKNIQENISKFKDRSWATFLKYTKTWISLDHDGYQKKLAQKFWDEHSIAEETDFSTLPIPDNVGYHRTCYSKFCTITLVRRVTASLEKKRNLEAVVEDHDYLEHDDDVELPDDVPGSSSATAGDSRHTFLQKCIICKRDRYERNLIKGTRGKAGLSICTAVGVQKLMEAAEEINDDPLLHLLRSKDCVAKKAPYHRVCYSDYTRCLSRPRDPAFEKNFEEFSDIVKKQVIVRKKMLTLSKLTKLFTKKALSVDGITKKAWNLARTLKARLQKALPELCFQRPSPMRSEEIVFVKRPPTRKRNRKRSAPSNTEDSSSNTKGSLSSSDGSSVNTTGTSTNSSELAKNSMSLGAQPTLGCHHLYTSAQMLKRDIGDVTSRSVHWLPTAECLAQDPNAARIVTPVALYNFLAWTVGASSETQPSSCAQVIDPNLHQRILNISQDIILAAASAAAASGPLQTSDNGAMSYEHG